MATATSGGLFGTSPVGASTGTPLTGPEIKVSSILMQLEESKSSLPDSLRSLAANYPPGSSENTWMIIASKYLKTAEEKHKKMRAGIIAFIVLLLLIIIGILIATAITARNTHP